MSNNPEQIRPGYFWDRILERHVPETYPGQLYVCATCEDTTFVILTDLNGIARSRKCRDCRESVAARLRQQFGEGEAAVAAAGSIPPKPKADKRPTWYEED